MTILEFIRLLRKHLVLIFLVPVLLVSLVIVLTHNPNYKYATESTLYTGIATGAGVEMDKSFNYFATNSAFDNLINIIKSRNTQQEVAIRLLTQHLLLDKPVPKYISQKSYDDLQLIVPAYIKEMVIHNGTSKGKQNADLHISSDTSAVSQKFSFVSEGKKKNSEVPKNINVEDYEKTVVVLTRLMESSDTNFIYKLLNFPNKHYSYKDISEIKVQRVSNSDLIKLNYETDDPGICQQTLQILTNVFIRNYRDIKENRSDAVVKYFEFQLAQASKKLKTAEDKLLSFNKKNNIINYYEQSKAVAVVKEDLDVEYYNKRIKLAGHEAAISRLEEKLENQNKIQLKSSALLDRRNQLGELNYQIASAESGMSPNFKNLEKLEELKNEAEKLKKEIKEKVSELYSFENSKNGLPIKAILNDWLANTIEAENIKAGLKVLGERIKEFEKQYEIYAPAGANIKRIERGISVSEQEFLEILHGLNLARLKMQDNQLSSNIKVVDPPFFPLSPIPTKRKILVVLAAMMGFMIIVSVILALEFFDASLKDGKNANKLLKLNSFGLIPKILLKTNSIPISEITKRLLAISLQNIELYFKDHNSSPKTIAFFSTQPGEGKSVIAANLASIFKNNGKKVVFLNYAKSSNIIKIEETRKKPDYLKILLGYPDSRIDYQNSLLSKPETYLEKDEYITYQIQNAFTGIDNIEDFLPENIRTKLHKIDYLFIELPAIIGNSYPIKLISKIDLPILICRANRVWTPADQSALNLISKTNKNPIGFILNGTEINAVEDILGELQKKRSRFRQLIKKIVLFQFSEKKQL